VIVGFVWTPVGVSYDGHLVVARVRRRRAPDERGLSGRVDALSSRPEEHTVITVEEARTLRFL